jgi:HEAT repeat protein
MSLVRKQNSKGSARLEDLVSDPAYKAMQSRIERDREEAVREFNEGARPLLDELAQAGFPSIELLRRRKKYLEAIPILLKWLPRIANYRVKESIVRALTVPWAKGAVAPTLIAEFKSADLTADSYKWTIGNALASVPSRSIAGDLIELLQDRKHGSARQMLALALAKSGDLRATDVLLDLLGDETLRGHAIIGLGKLASPRARLQLEPFLSDENAWIRREAKKALERIEKQAHRAVLDGSRTKRKNVQ